MSISTGLIRLTGFRSFRVSQYLSRTIAIRASSTVVHDVTSISYALEEKVQSKNVSGIHRYYPALITALKQTDTPSSSKFTSLSRQQVLTLLEVLATSGRPADLQRIEGILEDLPSVFGVEPSVDVHTAILRGLIKYGNVQTIHRWLLRMPTRPGHLTPTLEQFHLFLDACLDLATFRYVRHVIRTMRQAGCKPTNETFKYLIRSRWGTAAQEGNVPHLIVFSTILDDMKLENLPYDDSVKTLLREGFEHQGLHDAANRIQVLYETRFLDIQTPEKLQEVEWHSKLSHTAQSQGLPAAINLLKSLESEGCMPSSAALRSILRHSRTIDDLQRMQKEFDIESTVAHWSILINNNTRIGNIPNALSIYQESKKAGIVPDAALVGPIIRALCWSVAKPPSDESLETALSIYFDLAKAVPASSAPATPKESYDDHTPGPDIYIYNDLLRGLASSPNAEKHYTAARELLEDMESRKISTNDSSTASSLIVLFMRCSPTLSDALDVYYQLRSSLDERGYAVVLNTFCKLSFGDSLQAPSLSDYFEIVKDMRRAGLEITVEVYTILLHQLGVVATQSRRPDANASPSLQKELITTTRRTHDFLTLDAAVSPDAHVWNQLMDTYQRLGCFGDAYRVWETMYLSGRFDHVSVSIILDACGYANAWPVAKKISSQLFNDRFSFNLHNWNTWIECLCRLGKLNDALRVVCMEMGKNQNSVAPDVESARILIKFARRDDLYSAVAERLERHAPELWKMLPDDLRQS